MYDTPSEQDINLDLVDSRLIVVYSNQYDDDETNGSSSVINVHIYDQGEPFNLSDYTANKITLKMSRASKTFYTTLVSAIGGSVSGNIITFPIKNTMTMMYGRNECNFELEKDGDIKNTTNFYMRVYKNPVQQDYERQSDQFEDIDQKYIETQEQIKELANEWVTTTTNPPGSADQNDFWTRFY